MFPDISNNHPTDFHIFQRGRYTTNIHQPGMAYQAWNADVPLNFPNPEGHVDSGGLEGCYPRFSWQPIRAPMIALTWIKHQNTTENYFRQFLWGFKVEHGNLVPIHSFCRHESILDVHPNHWQRTLDGKSPISAIVHQFPFLGWTFKFHLAKIQQTHVKSLNPLVSNPESLIFPIDFMIFSLRPWWIHWRSPGSPVFSPGLPSWLEAVSWLCSAASCSCGHLAGEREPSGHD